MIKKSICLVLIFVLAFLFISCSQNETPYAEKISYDNYLLNLNDKPVFRYRGYVFFANENEFCVAEFKNDYLIKEMSFNKQDICNDGYKKIKNGMSVFDVVSLIGLPTNSFTTGLSSLDFESAEGGKYRIFWDSDMKVLDKTHVLTENNGFD